MACSVPPASCPSRRRARGPRPPAVLAPKPTASTSLAECRLVRGAWVSEGGHGGPQNWREPMLPGSRGDGGPRELGEEVAGPRFLGHEDGAVGGPDSVLNSPSQVSSTPGLPLEAVPQRAPATPSLAPRCPRPPISTSSAEQTACQPRSPLAGASEEPRNVWLDVPICLSLQLPECL